MSRVGAHAESLRASLHVPHPYRVEATARLLIPNPYRDSVGVFFVQLFAINFTLDINQQMLCPGYGLSGSIPDNWSMISLWKRIKSTKK